MLKIGKGMGNRKNGHTGGLYYKLWGSLFFWAMLVLVFTLLLFYWQFSNILLDKLQEADTEVLRQNENSFQVSKRIAYSITNRIFMDNSTAWLLYGRQYDPVKLSSATKQLSNYRASLPYIESIYVYNGSTRTITVNSANSGTYAVVGEAGSADSFFDLDALEILENLDHVHKRNVPVPRRITVDGYGRGEQEILVYTFVCTDSFLPYPSGTAVLVNFSYDWMKQVAALRDSEALATLVLDVNGHVVSDSEAYPAGTDVSQESFYIKMSEDLSESGRFREKINGNDMVVTYIAPDENGWRHVRITPYQNIVRELNQMLSIMLGIAAALFGLVMVGSYVSTKLLYRPIGKMDENLAELEEEYRLSSTTSRQHVLRDILFGIESNSSAMRRYIWELKIPRTEAHYRVVLLKINDYDAFINENDVPGQGLMRYAMINISMELCADYFSIEGVDTGEENGVALIVAMDPDQMDEWATSRQWEQVFSHVATAVERFLGHSVGFVVGDVCVSLSDIPDSYRRAKDAAFRRMFYKDNLVLMADYPMEAQREQDVVSNARRNAIAEAISGGDAERAKDIAREIVFAVEYASYTVVRLVVGRLVFLLDNIVRELHKGQPAASPEDLSDILRRAGSLNEKTLHYLYEAIDKIVESSGGQNSVKYTALIQRINQIIEERYCELDCSVVTIAQEVGLSTTYIGRIYKHYSFKTISESISAARMEHARRLLRDDRRMSVEQVAQRSGFSSSSYFSKTFRKENGMTPNEYRNGANLDKKPEEATGSRDGD